MGYDDLKIRDLSRLSTAWTPPISAMGGPPAHQLYSDLVAFAGMQLYRDGRARSWIVLRDGAQRRSFLVPSTELRSALDRFRMRRNLRPLTDTTIDEFVRIVAARISDPDVAIPLLREPIAEMTSDPDPPAPDLPSDGSVPHRWKELDEQIDTAIRELDQLEHHASEESAAPSVASGAGDSGSEESLPSTASEAIDPSISGARAFPTPPNSGVERYARVFRKLVQGGGWLGTTQELSRLTRTDPITLYDSLLKYREDLADQDILIANVEVEGSYRWLAVDRSRLKGASEASRSMSPTPPSE